jgi:predicted ATP-dependent endonuclease of OLD family
MKNNTKGIGFKNFRRFEDFPLLEFGNITYMVGRNNSGKSTMVKALLLIMDYLQNQLGDTFSFDNEVLEDANIVTFGRAKNNANNNPVISYDFVLNQFSFHIEISGDDETTEANVLVFVIEDITSGISLEINYSKGEVIVSRNITDEIERIEESSIIKQLKKVIDSLKEELEGVKDKKSKKTFKLQSDYAKAVAKLQDAKKISNQITRGTTNNYKVSYSLDAIFGDQGFHKNEGNPLFYIVFRIIHLNEINAKKKAKEVKPNKLEDVVALNLDKKTVFDSVNSIIASIGSEKYFYLGANPSKQSALFYLRDKQNALAQAIHKFYQLGITTKKDNIEELRFVKKWMDEFEVGYDLDITFVAGEAYDVKIYESEDKKEKEISSYLADKGMGSLQVMTIILRIASLIREKKKINNKAKIFTLLIEEPELNLHPSLQSKLTTFFHDIFLEFGFSFIIETHSEYVISQSQILWLKNEYFLNLDLNINPFKIFYFHKKTGPYEMIYKADGKFERSFGNGFFDEADSIAMKTYKLNLLKRKNG